MRSGTMIRAVFYFSKEAEAVAPELLEAEDHPWLYPHDGLLHAYIWGQ